MDQINEYKRNDFLTHKWDKDKRKDKHQIKDRIKKMHIIIIIKWRQKDKITNDVKLRQTCFLVIQGKANGKLHGITVKCEDKRTHENVLRQKCVLKQNGEIGKKWINLRRKHNYEGIWIRKWKKNC